MAKYTGSPVVLCLLFVELKLQRKETQQIGLFPGETKIME